METNPIQELVVTSAEAELLPLKYRKFSGDSVITTDSESWESDADSLNEIENEIRDESTQNLPRLSLDSGLAGQVVKLCSTAQTQEQCERKPQSILRAEPQVFKINDGKVRRTKSKSGENVPRKAVGFILPEGVKIPERAASIRKLPVHHRAQRTLRVLKQKLKGQKNSPAHVPWRPSAHTLGKVSVVRARQIQVDEKVEVREPVIIKITKYGDLKLKKLKVSEIETEDGLIIEAEEELDSGENSEQEDSGLNETDTEEEEAQLWSGKDAENVEKENVALKKHVKDEKKLETGLKSSTVASQKVELENDTKKQEEEDDVDFKISRRKAFRYHLKGIQAIPDKEKKIKGSNKKTPKFPIGGHGPCHAHKHYPHAQLRHINTNPVVPPVEPVEKKTKVPSEVKRSRFRIMQKKNSVEITNPDDLVTVVDVDNNNKEVEKPKKKSPRPVSKAQTQFDYLLNIARLIEPVPGPKVKPGKIVSTRYRRVPSYELFPYLA